MVCGNENILRACMCVCVCVFIVMRSKGVFENSCGEYRLKRRYTVDVDDF